MFRIAGEWQALCGYVATPADLLSDPHYRARDFWTLVDHPATRELKYPGTPVKMTASDWISKRAPLPGEHNQEIFGGLLGLSADEMAKLAQAKVI